MLKKFKESVDIEIDGIKLTDIGQETVLKNAAIFKDCDVWTFLPEVRIIYQKNDFEITVMR